MSPQCWWRSAERRSASDVRKSGTPDCSVNCKSLDSVSGGQTLEGVGRGSHAPPPGSLFASPASIQGKRIHRERQALHP